MPVADSPEHLGDLTGFRDPALAPEEAPGLHQRADRDVERALGLTAVPQALGEEREQLRIDGDGAPGRLAVEAGERALRLVVAHQPVDAVHLVEGRLDDPRQGPRVGPVGHDRVHAAHREAAALGAGDPVLRGREARRSGRREERAGEKGEDGERVVRQLDQDLRVAHRRVANRRVANRLVADRQLERRVRRRAEGTGSTCRR